MRRIVFWGVIAVLGMPVIATAEEPPSPRPAGNNAAEPTNRATGAILNQLTGRGMGIVTQTTEAKDSKYWIGLSCAPIDETLRSQMGLEAGSGLAIQQVADNSPAKEAGLALHDVITEVKIGDETHKPADVSQLTMLVQQAESKPMTFLLLRHGKPLNIAVTPRERNTANRLMGRVTLSDDPSIFRMAGPVMMLGGQLPAPATLPDDLTVVITKSGSQPVHITIRQKDRREWNLKEKETAVQPKHISQAVISVMAYLSKLAGRVDVQQHREVFTLEPGPQVNYGLVLSDRLQSMDGTEVRAAEMLGRLSGTPSPPSAALPYRKSPTLFSLQQRLDEIQKQQEQVTKTLDELRQALQKSQPQN